MASSFVVGVNRVNTSTEPRCLILCGSETRLHQRLISSASSRPNYEVYHLDGGRFEQFDVFTPAYRPSCTKLVHISEAEKIISWDWLIPWFAKTKNIRLILETDDVTLAEKLGKKVNTRGLVVLCEAPATPAAREKLLKIVCEWYPNYSRSQVNHFLNQHNWNMDACLELLDKLTLLNLPLNSDTLLMLGVCESPDDDFVAALQDDQTSRALAAACRVSAPRAAVRRLSSWLDTLARVKFSQGFLKPSHEIAAEVGISTAEVEMLQRQARRFEVSKINKAALALANAEKDIARGRPNMALELLVNSW